MPFMTVQEPRRSRWPVVLATVASVASIMSAVATMLPAAGAMQATRVSSSASPHALVWYNRRTGVYHEDGCQYFLKTADGRQIKQELAAQVGRPCNICIVAPRLQRGKVKAKRDERQRIYVLP